MEKVNNDLTEEMRKIAVKDHLCLIYKNQAEQFAAAVPFIKVGLERHEKCIYIADENTAADVLKALQDGGVEVEEALKNGALLVISKRETYLRQGYFDPDEMIQFLKTSTDSARKEGFNALRATGEMTWMLGEDAGVERAMEYEAKLNTFLANHDCLALCQYNKTRFSPRLLTDVIHTHPLVVASGVVCKNFYYVPVDEFLKAGRESQAGVERLLHNLIDRAHLESERASNQKFLAGLDAVSRAIQGARDLEQMMGDVLEAALSIFACDRAWLVYPSDPSVTLYKVPMERTTLEYPGAQVQGIELPIDLDARRLFQVAKTIGGPITADAESKPPIPVTVAKNWQVKSMIFMNIYPKIGAAYMFGLHQCSYKRAWTFEDKRLFQEIGRRLADGLTSLLLYRESQKSQQEYKRIIETANEGIWVIDSEQRTTFVNECLLRMLGYTAIEMLNRYAAEFIVPEENLAHTRELQERRKGKAGQYQRRLVCKDGRIILVDIVATPMFDDDKKFIGSFAMLRLHQDVAST